MTILSYLLQVTLGLAFFYAFYYAALRKETLFHTNRIYLIATLLTSIILPLIRIYILQLEHADSTPTPSIVYVGSYLETMNITVASEEKVIPWTKVLLTIYISGIFLLVLRMIREVLVIFSIKRNGEWSQINNHLCILSKEVKSPFSFFNTVFLPADHQFGESELAEIVAHEKAHINGGHTMDVLFMELACIALWPSPMIYLYRKKLREVHEFLADAAVLKDTPWENYASLLLAQKANNLQSRLTNQLIYSQLKNRLMMMTQKRSGFFARFKYLGLIPILLVSLVIFSFREKSNPDMKQIEPGDSVLNIYKDGLKIYSDSIMSADSWSYKHDSSILVITEDTRYFLNRKEIKYELLEQALIKAVNNDPERTIYIYPAKHSRVGDFDKFYKLEVKLKASFIYVIPKLNSDRANIYFGTDNIQSAAVVVKSGNKVLKENEDYEIDSATGKMKIINEAYLQSGMPINVSFNGDTLPTTTIVALKLPSTEPASALSKNNSGIEPFTYVEEMPHFPGENSTELMYKFISNTIKYPSVLNQNIEGMGIVQFVVEADGSISRIKVVRSTNQYIKDEVMRMMNVMAALPDKWIPGKHNGIAVPVSFTLPVKFVMPTASKKVELPIAEEQVFQQVEQMPRFPGCENEPSDTKSDCASQKMFKYIYEAIKYPAEDRQKGNEGMVIAKFVVESDGSISNAKVMRSASPGFSSEIIRVINGMNDLPEKWIPGQHEGKAVPVELVLPFKFVLQADQKPVIKKDDPAEEKTNSKTDIEQTPMFSMSPSPADDVFKIEFSKEVITAFVRGATGELWRKTFKEDDDLIQSFDVSKWTPGTYIVQAFTRTNTHSKLFVILHD